MFTPIRQTVTLSGGSVTLHAWGADCIEAHTLDLLTLTATLGAMRHDWQEFERGDVETGVWDCFWRLVNASVRVGDLPKSIRWADRLTLLTAMFDLNIEDADPKLLALSQRTQQFLVQGETRPQRGLMNS